MEAKTSQRDFSKFSYRALCAVVRQCFPKFSLEGLENLPKEPCIVVGNHCHTYGPIVAELYFPGERRTWCAGQMMHLKEVPEYAYQDFWSMKPKAFRWFYKLLSYAIAPLSVFIFNNTHTIGVYRDARIISTFRHTVSALKEGQNIIIFPEHLQPHNHIVHDFQDKFIDVAKLYYKQTGKAISFVPMYIAPKLKKVYIGTPLPYCPDAPREAERRRLCEALMDSITEMAERLPPHAVVPYCVTPRKNYPMNREVEHEKTSC